MKQEKKLNHRNCTLKYYQTGNLEHLVDGVNVIARGRYDHVYHEVKEKVRTGIRTIRNILHKGV